MPDAKATETPRGSTAGLGIRDALGLSSAQVLTAADVAAVVLSLSGQPWNAAWSAEMTPAARMNLAILVGVVIAGMIATALGGYRSITPSLRWYVAGAISGAVLVVANPRAGLGPALLLVIAVSFGCTSSVSTSLLFTQRIVRPIVAAASTEFTSRVTAPGVVARLVIMWMVTSALPSLTIALLVAFQPTDGSSHARRR